MLPNHDKLLSTGTVSSTKPFLYKLSWSWCFITAMRKIPYHQEKFKEEWVAENQALLHVWQHEKEGTLKICLVQSRVGVGSRNQQTIKWSENQNMIKETYKMCGKHVRKTFCLFQKRSCGRKGQPAASKGERQIHDWVPLSAICRAWRKMDKQKWRLGHSGRSRDS